MCLVVAVPSSARQPSRFNCIWRGECVVDGLSYKHYYITQTPIDSDLFVFLHLFFQQRQCACAPAMTFLCLMLALKFLILDIWGYMRDYRPWEASHLFSCDISRRMPSESCLGPPWGSSYEHICKNIYFWKRWIGLDPMVDKGVKNYIEWCSQNTKRLNCGQLY